MVLIAVCTWQVYYLWAFLIENYEATFCLLLCVLSSHFIAYSVIPSKLASPNQLFCTLLLSSLVLGPTPLLDRTGVGSGLEEQYTLSGYLGRHCHAMAEPCRIFKKAKRPVVLP
ncbi:hypothetical protein SUGI_1178970 [Cryptomeria japonica]|nr:hypothetical protein SUGI_1178970 [Cryptomeria japonica]